jgi:hypothetical protein
MDQDGQDWNGSEKDQDVQGLTGFKPRSGLPRPPRNRCMRRANHCMLRAAGLIENRNCDTAFSDFNAVHFRTLDRVYNRHFSILHRGISARRNALLPLHRCFTSSPHAVSTFSPHAMKNLKEKFCAGEILPNIV